MSKIVLPNVASADRLTTINDNFQKVEDALNNNVLYRDNLPGEPNAMSDDLDMNGKRIYNIGSLSLSGDTAVVAQAENISFSPVGSLSSNTVQDAISELDSLLVDHINNIVNAHLAVYEAKVNLFTKNQTVSVVSLTDASSISTDALLSNNFKVVLSGNRTLANPVNLVNGTILNWKIKQDTTGSRTLSYGSKFKWAGGVTPVLSTSANAIDFITAQYFSDEDILVAAIMKGIA